MTLTTIGGNVDFDKIVPFINESQTIYLQDKTGTNLLKKVIELIDTNEIDQPQNADYKFLLTEYMTPIVAYNAAANFVRSHAITVENAGVLRNQPIDTFVPEMSVVDVHAQRFNDVCAYIVNRMIEHITFNANKYPEYFTNTGGDVFPRYGTQRTPWKL